MRIIFNFYSISVFLNICICGLTIASVACSCTGLSGWFTTSSLIMDIGGVSNGDPTCMVGGNMLTLMSCGVLGALISPLDWFGSERGWRRKNLTQGSAPSEVPTVFELICNRKHRCSPNVNFNDSNDCWALIVFEKCILVIKILNNYVHLLPGNICTLGSIVQHNIAI